MSNNKLKILVSEIGKVCNTLESPKIFKECYKTEYL